MTLGCSVWSSYAALVKSTHAYYWGNIRDQLHERHEKVKAEVGAAPGVDRTFHEGRLMADYEVQALIEQLSTRGNESFLFELGFMIREAAERATRDADRARRDVERSDDPDRSFHDGRACEDRFIVTLTEEQAESFGIPLEEVALDGLDPDRDIG